MSCKVEWVCIVDIKQLLILHGIVKLWGISDQGLNWKEKKSIPVLQF